MNFKARELMFCLKDKNQFDEETLKKALKAEGFPDVQVVSQKSEVKDQKSEVSESDL
jgi:hypothetical protein